MSLTDTPDARRKRRLGQLAAKLGTQAGQNKGADLSLARVRAWACMTWGIRAETFTSYLGVLEDGGLLVIDEKEDRISWLG